MTWIRTRELREIDGYLFAIKFYEEERMIIYECLDDETLSAAFYIDENRYEPLGEWSG
jgi:hypothetical protein